LFGNSGLYFFCIERIINCNYLNNKLILFFCIFIEYLSFFFSFFLCNIQYDNIYHSRIKLLFGLLAMYGTSKKGGYCPGAVGTSAIVRVVAVQGAIIHGGGQLS